MIEDDPDGGNLSDGPRRGEKVTTDDILQAERVSFCFNHFVRSQMRPQIYIQDLPVIPRISASAEPCRLETSHGMKGRKEIILDLLAVDSGKLRTGNFIGHPRYRRTASRWS